MTSLLNLTSHETQIYNAWFQQIAIQPNPKQAAARFLALSGLPRQMLAYIWSTSGLNQNQLDIQRFYLIMRMVSLAQQGYEPSPDTIRAVQNVNIPFFGYDVLPIADETNPIWVVPTSDLQYYTKGFHQLTGDSGQFSFEQATTFFVKSGLPVALIEQVLRLADLDSDNKLDDKQFIIAMHLAKLLRANETNLPDQLPEKLIASVQPEQKIAVALADSTTSNCSSPITRPEVSPKSEVAVLTEKYDRTKAEVWRYANTAFSDTDALHVAKLLFRDDHQHVRQLEIIAAELSSDAVAAFGKMLTHNTGLNQLLFEDVTIIGEGSFSLLISCLGRNQTVQKLHLAGCNITENDAEILSEIVAKTSSLREINLLRNSLSYQACLLLHNAVQRNPLHIGLNLPFDLVPGSERSEPRSLSENDSISVSCKTSEIARFRNAQSSSLYLPGQVASPDVSISSVEIRIKNLSMEAETLLKDFAIKLSFNLITNNVNEMPSYERLQFMHLQIPGNISTYLLTVLSLESVRTKLLEELRILSQNVSAAVLDLGNTLAHFQTFERRFKDDLPQDIFIRHKMLTAQFLFHTNRPLFAFYRSLHLILCNLWLSCLLDGPHISFRLEDDYTIKLQVPVIETVKRLSLLSTTNHNWIYSVSEELARRLSFRYESQIRQLNVSNSMQFAVHAVYRIMAALEKLPEISAFKDLVVHLLDQVGNPSIKLKSKKKIAREGSDIRWNPDSVFMKSALAVISGGCDGDRWVIDDDQYSLWSGKRFRPSKYGYRICSLSELNAIRPLKEVPSPPNSRWLGSHELIRAERQQYICVQLSGLNAHQAKVSDSPALDNTEQPAQRTLSRTSNLKATIQQIFKTNSSRGSAPTSSQPK